MQQFIRSIIDFIYNIIDNVQKGIQSMLNTYTNAQNYMSIQAFRDFLSKDVFLTNSLVGINITWNELIIYFGTMFFAIFFIVLFIKFVLKLLSIFRV